MKKLLTRKNIILAGVVVVLLLAALVAINFVKGDGKPEDNLIAKGVTVANINVGEASKEEATEILNKKLHKMGTPIFNFQCEGVSFTLTADEIALKADVKKAVEDAFLVGRGEDKIQSRKELADAKKGKINIKLGFEFDRDKLLVTANEYLSDKISDPSPMLVEIGEDCLVVTNAVPGMVVSMDKAKAALEKELSDFVADKPITLVIEKYTPKNLTFEEFKDKYLHKAKDAVYTKEGDKHHIEPEVIGIDFDENEAKGIFEKNKNSKESYKIPAKITYPEVTAKELEDKYVNKIIASYSTSFAGSSEGRCTNIYLAAEKINGYVLNPGERFSYNQVVGPRTAAAGFKMAHVYVGNQVVDGIGGGICQVSSTLYNAVVMADLKTVSRTNHSIPVNYVPLGRDATVSYGTIDYVFENNKPYPVSIKCVISGTTLTISIVGTSESDYTVEFVSSYNSSIPFSTIKEEDPSLNEGEEKVISQGSNGSVYDSYRVYKKDGKEYDRKYESKSRYQPTAKRIAVGTKKGEPELPFKEEADAPPEAAEPEMNVPEANEPSKEEEIGESSAEETSSEEVSQNDLETGEELQ